MTRPDPVLPDGVVIVSTTPDAVTASAGRDLRSFRPGEPEAGADFARFVGADRVVVCDSAPLLVAALAGERPAAGVWKLLEGCRVYDVRIGHAALGRTAALVPRPRSFAELSREFAPGVHDPAGRLVAAAVAFFSELPDGGVGHADSPCGPLGVGHATRAAVAAEIADRRVTGRLPPDLAGRAAKHPARHTAVPRSGDLTRIDRFLAERFGRMLDEAGMRFPRPADEGGLLSRDLRDWGPLADADPLLLSARARWAVEGLSRNEPGPVRSADRPAAPGSSSRSRLDYGVLRPRLAPLLRPKPGEAFLLVTLNHLACRSYFAVSRRDRRLLPPWFEDSLSAPGGPAARLTDAFAGPEALDALGPPGFSGLPRERRFQVVDRLLEALIAGFDEAAATAYVRQTADASDVPAAALKRLRERVLWETLMSVENYGDDELGRRLAELAGPAHPFDVVSLGRDIAGDPSSPEGPVRRPGGLLRGLVFGTHADVPREADELWRRLAERIGAGGSSDGSTEVASRDRLAVRQKLSERPVGPSGSTMPKVPFWQAPPLAARLAAEEIRGVAAFALARYGCGLLAMDGDEFLLAVPEPRAQATAATIPALIGSAVGNLIGDERTSRAVAAGCCTVKEVSDW